MTSKKDTPNGFDAFSDWERWEKLERRRAARGPEFGRLPGAFSLGAGEPLYCWAPLPGCDCADCVRVLRARKAGGENVLFTGAQIDALARQHQDAKRERIKSAFLPPPPARALPKTFIGMDLAHMGSTVHVEKHEIGPRGWVAWERQFVGEPRPLKAMQADHVKRELEELRRICREYEARERGREVWRRPEDHPVVDRELRCETCSRLFCRVRIRSNLSLPTPICEGCVAEGRQKLEP